MSGNVSVRKTGRSMMAIILLLSIFVTSFVFAPVMASAEVETSKVYIPMEVTTTNMRIPKGTYEKGTAVSIGGRLKVNYGTIYKVKVYIQNTKTGKSVYGSVYWPDAEACNIGPYIKQFSVKKLSAGSYRYKVIAYTRFESETESFLVVNSPFTIVNKKPVLSIKYEQHPNMLEAGNKGRFAGTVRTSIGKITKVYAVVKNAKGKVMMDKTYKPNENTFDIRKTVNYAFPMAVLPVGDYYYTLTVTAKGNGYTITENLVNRARIRIIK